MIIGIGNDLINISRIEKAIERFGDRFINRIFTEKEQAKSEKRQLRIESYAKRFAAKEACSKALGTGFRKGVFWRDMGVVNLPSGKPTLELTGGAPPVNSNVGLPEGKLTTPISRQNTPFLKPVPNAFEHASFAAKRLA